jgi:uncharacterized integral membrane protein
MSLILKKIFFGITFNCCLFLLLMIGIQNSSNKSKVNFFIDETIKLPISFIVGTNFIFGSLLGTFITINLTKKD